MAGQGQIPLAARKARFNRWIDDRPAWQYGKRGQLRAAIARARSPHDLLVVAAAAHGTTAARVRRARLG